MNSLTRLMRSTISIPDYSSISKRSISIPRHVLSQTLEPGNLVIVDSTGLKVYGKDEWHQEKHDDVPARRTWRKLHLAIDEHPQVLASELTTPEVGDPSAVADLLTQSSPLLRPSSVTVPTMASRFRKLFWTTSRTLKWSFPRTKQPC